MEESEEWETLRLVGRQQAKVVSFHVLAVGFALRSPRDGGEDFAAGGGRWSGKECALWARGDVPYRPLDAQVFSLKHERRCSSSWHSALPRFSRWCVIHIAINACCTRGV